MSQEQSFPEDSALYFDQQRNRVLNPALEEYTIYTAFAKIYERNSGHTSVAFPVQIEYIQPVDESQQKKFMGTVAINMVLLDEDLSPMISKPYQAIVQEGIWHVNEPIPVSRPNIEPVKLGYFLLAMPNDPDISQFIDSNDSNDPHGTLS